MGKVGLVANIAGLLALFHAFGGAAPARRRRWRINLAPRSAKATDFVVFARRALGGCVALAVAGLPRWLALLLALLACLAFSHAVSFARVKLVTALALAFLQIQ